MFVPKVLPIALTASVLALAALPAQAQDRAFSFGLTGGAALGPTYFGSNRSEVTPMARFSFSGLQFGGVSLGDADRTALDGPAQFAPGFGLRGAFRYIPKRDGLTGLDDVKASVELGGGVHYTDQNWQVFADLRYGVIGHRGLSGEVGANLIYRGDGGLVLHAGPRAEFGNSRFAQTYFGVSQAESGPSGLAAYTAGSGFHSMGFEVGAYQALSPDWGVTGNLRFDRLRGDAAASPIVQQGRRDQITAEIGLTRHFNLRF